MEDLRQQRLEKLNKIKELGKDPFVNAAKDIQAIGPIVEDFKEGVKVKIAGRLVANRAHGKASFFDIKDSTGKIQNYIKKNDVNEAIFSLFDNLDIGDIIFTEGELFKTRTGEPTVKVDNIILLAKSLRALPEKWHGLKNIETRYRQRYLDLLANQQVKEIFLKRSSAVKSVREFLDQKGYMEVETPMMHLIAGGAAGRPFKTFHNEYSMDLYLRIAPELFLKRLIVGGLDKVYEINRSFRNEGVSTRHNPEFTMLEVYTAYADYEDMMNLTEEVICYVAQKVLGKEEFEFQGQTISLKRPWRRKSFAGAVKDKFDINPEDDAQTMLKKLQSKGKAKTEKRLSRSQVVRIVEDLLQEGESHQPTFFTDYFSILCPLAKRRSDNPHISERFELFMGGMEVANAYSELNNPLEQKQRFIEDGKDATGESQLDEDFIEALEYGMPPTGGLGIGIDRLIMLLTDQSSIREVILFPLLRPEADKE